MSGPKVDIAKVRAQEMAQLEAARNSRKNVSDKINNLIKQINDSIDIESMMQDESLATNCKKVEEKRDECCKELNKILSIVRTGNEKLKIEELSIKADRIVNEYRVSIKSDLVVIGQMAKISKRYQEIEANRKQIETAKKKTIVILTQKEVENENTDIDVGKLAEDIHEEIKDFLSTTEMSTKFKNLVLQLNQDVEEVINSEITEDRKQKRLKRYFEEFTLLSKKIKTEEAEMKLAYEEYIKENFDINTAVKRFEEFESRAEIDEAIIYAKEQADEQVSKEYIKRQIADVMSRHGYDIVKSDLLSESENGQVLYGVDNDTAINVFISKENQVTMRVVGIGFDSDISEKEDEVLFQQQCAFCSMHPKITAELAMRGVILETKKHMPPNKRFNKKIQTKKKTDSDTTSKLQKKRKRTELKTMSKE